MSAAYRAGRAVLAAVGALVLVGFVGWHVLVWRMGEVYRWDNTKGQGNA